METLCEKAKCDKSRQKNSNAFMSKKGFLFDEPKLAENPKLFFKDALSTDLSWNPVRLSLMLVFKIPVKSISRLTKK